MGDCSLRNGADHGHRSGRQELCCRCEEKRSVVFPQWDSAFDSRPRSGRHGIHAGIRRWKFFGVRDGSAERLDGAPAARGAVKELRRDRKSTRLNSSHLVISYAVFCLKKKTHLSAKSSLALYTP